MKALVIYDSVFGNTKEIAMAIGNALNHFGETEILNIEEINNSTLTDIDVLLVGSPTRQFNATKKIMDFINSLPSKSLKGIHVSAFDTRISVDDINSKFLNFMVKIFGYAAEPIAKKLVKKGGKLIVPPAGFFVNGNEGPLKDGEIKRAVEWAKKVEAKDWLGSNQ